MACFWRNWLLLLSMFTIILSKCVTSERNVEHFFEEKKTRLKFHLNPLFLGEQSAKIDNKVGRIQRINFHHYTKYSTIADTFSQLTYLDDKFCARWNEVLSHSIWSIITELVAIFLARCYFSVCVCMNVCCARFSSAYCYWLRWTFLVCLFVGAIGALNGWCQCHCYL